MTEKCGVLFVLHLLEHKLYWEYNKKKKAECNQEALRERKA